MAKILVAEQSDAVRNVVCKLLRNKHHLVESFSDSRLAFVALIIEYFDLIVTDWKMSPFDGDDMVRFARQRGVDLPPIIAITGGLPRECEQAFRACLPYGHYFVCIYKPDIPEMLLAEVEKALSSG